MPRGARKSPMEKLQEQLNEVRESIEQYEKCLITLKEKEKYLQEQIDLEEFKKLRSLLQEKGIEVEDLKEIIKSNVIPQEQNE